MPSTPYASLRVKVNGGAPQTGDVVVSAGDTIQIEAESYDGWSTPVARWEIYSFPEGWTGPASGWTSESVTQTDGTTATVWYYLGNSAPPSFTMPAIAYWGKFLLKLTVNGGYKGGEVSVDVVDDSTMLNMLSSLGLKDLAWRENVQAGSHKKWVRHHQDNLRVLNTSLAAATPSSSTPAVVSSSTGSAGVSALYARGDHSHQLTFSTLNTILGTASASISVNGQTLTSGGFIAPSFRTSAANPSGDGLLRGAHGQILVASRDSTNSNDVPIVSYGTDATDHVTLGDSLIPCMRFVIASGCDFEFYGDTQLLYTLSQGSLSIGATHAFNITHTTGTGDGNNAVIEAQGGAATFAGGDLTLKSGQAGTGSTSGDLVLDARQNAAGTSTGTIRLKGNAVEMVSFSQNISASKVTVAYGADDTVFDTKVLYLDATNVAINAATATFGSGLNVAYIGPATTEPSGDQTTGNWLWSYDNTLKTKNHALTVLAPKVTNATGSEDLRSPDRVASRTTTTDAAQTTALTYAVPNNCVAFIKANVVVWTSDGGTSAVYEIRAGVKRFAGGVATLIGAVDVFAREDNAALDATIDVDGGNNARVRVTGISPSTYEWFVTADVTLMQP